MRNLSMKVCKHCGTNYQPTGSSSKYCSKLCYKHANIQYQRDAVQKHRLKHNKGQVGVGRGALTGFGKDNQNYRNGLGVFANARKQIKEDIRYCQLCGKDLLDTTRYDWCVHHVDHNRQNNNPSNWMLICKKCHQIEHKCWLALQGSTTSLIRLPNGRYSNPNKRSTQERCEMPETLSSSVEGCDIV